MSGWNFVGQNLGTGSQTAPGGNLSNSNLSNANLTNANLNAAILTNADFTNALVTGANLSPTSFFPIFDLTTTLKSNQLYSTASYKARTLTGINFNWNDLTSWNFANQNLAGSQFYSVSLANADFTNANLSGATLAFANMTGTILTGANLSALAPANNGFNLTNFQFYSTANYVNHNLSGINFSSNNLSAWNFSAQNLTNTVFTSATLTNTIFSDADLRGAVGWNSGATGIISTNSIRPDGSINGLTLTANEMLVVRNYPLVITANTAATFDPLAILQLQLGIAWTSTLKFAAGLTPSLNGTLDLELAPTVDPQSLVGQTLQLFVWNTPPAAGNHFATITSDPRIAWDLSNLYTNGTITAISAGSAPVPEPASILLTACLPWLLLRRTRPRRA